VTTNVLLVTKGLGRGGAERLLVSGIGHLDRSRFHVEVAYLLPWKEALVADLQALDVPVHLLASRRAFDLRWTFGLRRLVQERQIDLVHTHMPFVGIGARLVVARRGARLVHTEHNLWSRYRLPTRIGNMLTIGRNRTVIAVSSAVAASMHVPAWLPVRLPPIEVVRHGADLASVRAGDDARAAGRALLGLSPGERAIGCVGNFTAKKDHHTLLRAFASLAATYPELRLVLVGSGPLEAELRAEVGALGLGPVVVFTGMRDDVSELLPAFDVFVLSSRYEGLPIALLEAMATGVPSVATRVGGIPEVVTDGVDGLLIEPGEPDEIVKAVDRILGDPALAAQLGANAASRSAEFDLASAVGRTQAIYDEVLADT
jgi:glycosyltransferase involved in cell wall biosynthesis